MEINPRNDSRRGGGGGNCIHSIDSHSFQGLLLLFILDVFLFTLKSWILFTALCWKLNTHVCNSHWLTLKANQSYLPRDISLFIQTIFFTPQDKSLTFN
ncbi:unnamed protein product [Adineta ricciae]|uniref:Uncharacterized protein n=1 Tax=Adineta ricciae TaxID=249248 RepID=A0A814AIV9_ADIRI|nr:unnamed protein product [Adineta ricciae]